MYFKYLLLFLVAYSAPLFESPDLGDPTNYLNQGNKAYLKGKLADAMKLYSKASKSCIVEEDKVENNKALVHAQKGNYNQALENLNAAISSNPNNGNSYFNRGIIHTINNDFSLAVDDLVKAKFLGVSEEQDFESLIATAYYLDGQYAKASAQLVLSTNPNHQYLKGLIEYGLQNFAAAANAFDIAQVDNADQNNLKYAQGLAHYHVGNTARGLSLLDEIKADNKFLANDKLILAQLAIDAGDTGKAELALKAALKADKNNAIALARLGSLSLDKGDVESAAQYFNKSLRANRNNAEALSGTARIDFVNGAYKKSVERYKTAVAINPQDQQSQFGLALAAMHIPDPYTCLDALDKIDKSNLNAEQIEKVVLLEASALGICNKKQEAVKLLSKYRRYASDKYKIKTMLAYYNLRMFKYRSAISNVSISKFEEYLPYLIAGHASLHTKNHAGAYRYYRKAYKIDPKNPDVLMGAALSMTEINMKDQSKKVIDSLETLYPENYYVFNSKGIIYKDIALYHQKKNQTALANKHFDIAAKAFKKAREIQPSLSTSFDNNLGLTYFHKKDYDAAEKLFASSSRLAAINNLALIDIVKGNYSAAITRLDSLNKDYFRKNNVTNSRIESNLALAKKRAPMNNNYKFITYYFLHQGKPQIDKENPFKIKSPAIDLPADLSFKTDLILEYSDVECEEPEKRVRKKKKRKKIKLKFLKKKKSTDCPTFKT